MVAGFEPPTAGDIRIDGAPDRRRRPPIAASSSRATIRSTAGSPPLGNVEFGLRMRGVADAREREQKARHYLELVGLTGQDHKHPAELSGGMKQRIQIARVLANEPQMLLMDEPFAALDAQTRADMQRELRSIWRATRKTVLFITHDIDEAIMLGDRIGVMHAGPASKLKGVVDVDAERRRARAARTTRFVAVYRAGPRDDPRRGRDRPWQAGAADAPTVASLASVGRLPRWASPACS